MRRKRIPPHAGATPVKRGGKTVGFRAQVIHPVTGKKVSANAVLRLKANLYPTKAEASAVCWQAEELLGRLGDGNVTVAQLAQRWLDWGWNYQTGGGHWKKEAARIINEQRVKKFVELYGDVPVPMVTDQIADDYDALNLSASHIDSLKVMFNWAISRNGGRLRETNPFEGFTTTKGSRAQMQPPKPEMIDRMIEAAYDIYPPFGAWLEFACFSGCRPGEIDLLRWTDLSDGWTHAQIERQWNSTSKSITLPKNSRTRRIKVLDRAERALQMARAMADEEHVFANSRGGHFRQESRIYHWNKVRERVGLAEKNEANRYVWTLYLCTRHFTGWYMVNELEQDSEDVAIQLGHTDGGQLVRTLYGHREHARALDRIGAADAMFQATQADLLELAEAA